MIRSRVSLRFGIVFTLLAAMVLTLGFPTPSHASTVSTEGTEFWVTFDDHYSTPGAPSRILYLSSQQAGSATITWPDNSQDTYTFAANSITTVTATSKGIISDWLGAFYSAVRSTSARISSTVPISVYGAGVDTFTSDAFVAIPTSSLGTSYRVISWPDAYLQQVSIIAAEAGTTSVTVTPSVTTTTAKPAGSPYTVSLQQGQVHTVIFNGGAGVSVDASGTQVSANKKIVVTSSLSNATLGEDSGDHLVSYMPPLNSWGTSFLLPGSLNSLEADRYRILADQPNTEVKINGATVATLGAGQVYTYGGRLSGGIQQVDMVETSKPVLIAHGYLDGRYGASNQSGDPAFSLVTPTAQFLRQYTVSTPASGFAVNSVTLITKTSSVSTVRLNGSPVSAGSFTAVSGTDFSVARLEVAAGNYSISGGSGVGVYVAGFNNANSYAYPGGFALVNLIETPGGVDEILSNISGTQAPSDDSGESELAATGADVSSGGWATLAGIMLVLGGLFLMRLKRSF